MAGNILTGRTWVAVGNAIEGKQQDDTADFNNFCCECAHSDQYTNVEAITSHQSVTPALPLLQESMGANLKL